MSTNPTRVRSVTIIVTHEDERRDFSRTYTPRQILDRGIGYRDINEAGVIFRDWEMTTIEDHGD